MARTAALFDAGITVVGATVVQSISATSAAGITTLQAAGQDAVRVLGRAGGGSSFVLTLTPTTLTSNRTLTLPDADATLAGLSVAQTWSATQTFGTANSTGGALNGTLGATTPSTVAATTVTASSLTSGRVPIISTGGLLTDSSNLLFSGSTLTVTGSSGATQILASSASGSFAQVVFQTSGSARWLFAKDSNVESAADAGSDFIINARTDGGGSIDVPLRIVRAAGGAITLARPTTVSTATALGTPSATQVLLGNGRVYAGNTTSTSIQTAGGITAAGALTVASDTDATTILGRARISSLVTDEASFGHFDQATGPALTQLTGGRTVVNAATGQELRLATGGVTRATVTTTAFTLASGVGLAITQAAVAATPTPTHTFTVVLNGVTYRVPCVV